MIRLYLSVFLLILLSSCSKDFLKRYDDRIEGGEWTIVDVDRPNGGSFDRLPFREGDRFSFFDDGTVRYVPAAGGIYEGTWDIIKKWNVRTEGRVNTLTVSAADFMTQDVRAGYFDEMRFTGTNRFVAYMYDGWRVFKFRFRR